jgi:hypothetical protein
VEVPAVTAGVELLAGDTGTTDASWLREGRPARGAGAVGRAVPSPVAGDLSVWAVYERRERTVYVPLVDTERVTDALVVVVDANSPGVCTVVPPLLAATLLALAVLGRTQVPCHHATVLSPNT